MYKDGSEAYAKSVGLPLDILTTEANSQKGLTDIRAEVARTGGNVVFCIDPNDASDALPIAKTLEAAGIYFVTWWSKPADVKAWDYPHWVAHIAMDGVAAGTYTATELIKTLKTPGKGKIIALQGRLGDTAETANAGRDFSLCLRKIQMSNWYNGNLRNGKEARRTRRPKRC